MTSTKRILILTADAGFGHRSAAKAIEVALQELHPADCVVEIVNPMQDERVPAVLRRSGADYDWAVREIPRLYQLGYEAADSVPSSVMVHGTMAAMLFGVMGDLIGRHQPDAIIALYPLYQAPLAVGFLPSASATLRCSPWSPTTRRCTAPGFTKRQTSAWSPFRRCATRPSSAASRRTRSRVTGIPVHPSLTHEEREPACHSRRAGLAARSDDGARRRQQAEQASARRPCAH